MRLYTTVRVIRAPPLLILFEVPRVGRRNSVPKEGVHSHEMPQEQ